MNSTPISTTITSVNGPISNDRKAEQRRSGGALENTLLPAIEKVWDFDKFKPSFSNFKLSRAHSQRRNAPARELDAVAKALVSAESICPGLCDQLLTEVLRTLAFPSSTKLVGNNHHDVQLAMDRLRSSSSSSSREWWLLIRFRINTHISAFDSIKTFVRSSFMY